MKRCRTTRSVWLVVLTDILIGALALCLVVFFQLGLPYLQEQRRSQDVTAPLPEETAAVSTRTPDEIGKAPEGEPSSTETPEGEPEPTAEATPEPDTRTEWQIRFADHFTDQVVVTDHSYTSPQVSITIETKEYVTERKKAVYHVADIYIASLDNFRTYTAHNKLAYGTSQDVMEMDRDSHAILAINGDFYSCLSKGFLVRNGEVYKSDRAYCDLCVLYDSGEMACYSRKEYAVEDILSQGVAQAWNFGPSLLDENGMVKAKYELSTVVANTNPRSAVGYYEPGHYCFIVVDGRQDGYSKGLTIPELAGVFKDLGCVCAYNLDGGGSALMTFLHERFSRQSNGAERHLGDILLITEDGWEDIR